MMRECDYCGVRQPDKYLRFFVSGWEHYRDDGGPDRLIGRVRLGPVACLGCAVEHTPAAVVFLAGEVV